MMVEMKKIPGDWFKDFYTPVQHSGMGYGDDRNFEKGLETRSLEELKQLQIVMIEGGILFDNLKEAEDYCEYEMYRETEGIIPRAPGTFHEECLVDGLKLYIPKERNPGWQQEKIM